MALVVQKFGGTSVGSIERIRNVAKRCLAAQRKGDDVVVIVSAMSGETNRLLKLAHEVTEVPDAREMDAIAATGEQVAAALTAMAIQHEGGKARSLLGHQVKILTDGAFTKARIKAIEGSKIFSTVRQGEIAVVAGFQGVDEKGDITTLGRGGSDTTAVAIAAAIGADACEIYTDVDGVYTTDPSVCPSAKKISRISYEEMLELASLGAKVLQIRSVEIAMKYGVPVHVRTSFNESEGTWVTREDKSLEDVVVAGVAYDKGEARVSIVGFDDKLGAMAELFGAHRGEEHFRRHDRADRGHGIRGPRIGDVHASEDRPRARQTRDRSDGEGARRARDALRRRHREGLDRRPRHALARGHRVEDVRAPREGGHPDSGDLDERNQSVRSGACKIHGIGRAHAARRVRSRRVVIESVAAEMISS